MQKRKQVLLFLKASAAMPPLFIKKVRKLNPDILPNFLKNRAALTPNREAIVFKDKRLTFKELYQEAYYRAGVLTASGVTEKAYVGFLVKSDLDTVISLLALQIIGAKAVLLNNRLTADELVYQLNDARVEFLVTEPVFNSVCKQIKEQMPALNIMDKQAAASYAEPSEKKIIHLADTCTIMYTSGTTGFPKGVIQTYGNHWWSAMGSVLNLGLHEKDAWLCAVPLFHISGYSILIRSMVYGIKLVLHDHFEVDKILRDIEKEKISIMSVVTTMLQKIEFAVEKSLPLTFRCMLLGGGPASLDLLNSCMKKGIPVYYSYGMTETSSQIVTLASEYSTKKIGSAGKALFPAQIKIMDDKGNETAPNIPGEIAVYGPNVSQGYLNKGKISIDGWFYTGDIGYIDSEGFLFVLDRRTDLIISGGENIYPAEIEGVLTAINGIIDAGVVGEKNEEWGEVPIAFVVKEHNVVLTEETILNICKQKLAKYKVPKKVYFISEIPRNASKKILRRKLRN